MKYLRLFENFKKEELDDLLNKRLEFLKKFSEDEKRGGYAGLKNLRIQNQTILFNDDIEDCRYDDNFFYVVGTEGEKKIELKGNFLNKIKKVAKELDSGGLN